MADQSKDYLKDLLQITRYNLVGCGYQKLTVDGTVKTLTIPTGARYAFCVLESTLSTPAIRCLQTGGTPTTTDGMSYTNLERFDIQGYQNLTNFKTTQVAAGTHTLHIEYYK